MIGQGKIYHTKNNRIMFRDSNGSEIDITNIAGEGKVTDSELNKELRESQRPYRKVMIKGGFQERENSQMYKRISLNVLKDPVQEELNNLSGGKIIIKGGLDEGLRFIY